MGDQADEHAFEHYNPEHPLPSEIRDMKRDSTVCKFCGVSYLIHNEIKMLEDKLRTCEEELELLRGQEQREKDLLLQLQEEEQKTKSSKSELTRRDKILGNMKEEMRETQQKLIAESETKEKVEQQLSTANGTISVLRRRLKDTHTKLTVCHSQLSTIREAYQQLKSHITSSIQQTQQETMDTQRKCVAKFQHYITELITQREKLTETISHNEKQLKNHVNTIDKLRAEVSVTEDKSIQLECKTRNLEQQLQENVKELEACVVKNRTLSLESQQYKDLLKNKTNECEETSKVKQQYEGSIKLLNDTIDRQSLEMSRLKREVSDMTAQCDKQKEETKEILREKSLSSSEIGGLKASLVKSQEEVESLINEREMSISAHQSQISDLRESFKNKLMEMELWPQKLEKALNEERRIHKAEMDAKLAELGTSKVEEIKILQDKHDELLKKYTAEIHGSNGKHLIEISNLKSKLDSESGRWKKLIEESQARFEKTETVYRSEIEGLKNVINDLESRIAKLGSEQLGLSSAQSDQVLRVQQKLAATSADLDKATAELIKAQEEVVSLQETVRRECEERFELTEALSDCKNMHCTLVHFCSSQVVSLQETVRRECEERFELTEALSDAREELLASKGIVGGRLSSHQVTSPPPISSSTSNLSFSELLNSGTRRQSNELSQSRRSSLSSSSAISPSYTRDNVTHEPISASRTKYDAKTEAISASEVGISVTKDGKVKSSGKMRGNSIAQHRRRIATLLGKNQK